MTRIVAGVAKGRRLEVPARVARPTSDRAREALFSALEAHRGSLAGARVLDLYAGSGALGLEALSRGAAAAVLVDSHRQAAEAIRRNIATTGLPAVLVADDVVRTLGRPDGTRYDVVLADPPYDLANEQVEQVLGLLTGGGWLAAGADVVVERSRRTPPFAWPPGLEPVRDRAYGEALLWYGRAS